MAIGPGVIKLNAWDISSLMGGPCLRLRVVVEVTSEMQANKVRRQTNIGCHGRRLYSHWISRNGDDHDEESRCASALTCLYKEPMLRHTYYLLADVRERNLF
jgi:hypothetical protein